MHYSKDIHKINSNLQKTKKLFISTGCSYVHGMSAWDLDFLDEFPPIFENHRYSFNHLTNDEKEYVLKKYSNLSINNDNSLNTHNMEVDNSFTTQLHKKYMNDWTIANLGRSATGILSSVYLLYLLPIQYDMVDEIILFFSPTSLQRFDILNDCNNFLMNNIGNEFTTIWPNPIERQFLNNGSYANLEDGYFKSIYSEKFEVLQAIMAFKLLNDWVKLHNAKLIIFPAFNKYYNRNYFYERLQYLIRRDAKSRDIIDMKTTMEINMNYDNLLDLVPWDEFVEFDGKKTFFDLAFSQEDEYNPNIEMQSLCGVNGGTKNNYIMKCGHPDTKSHSILTDYLYKFISNNLLI
jgi:hypothetical protein